MALYHFLIAAKKYDLLDIKLTQNTNRTELHSLWVTKAKLISMKNELQSIIQHTHAIFSFFQNMLLEQKVYSRNLDFNPTIMYDIEIPYHIVV